MLVLSRKRGDVIKIGDDIEVVIVDIRGDKVRFGITAPKAVLVHRGEVYADIRRENAAAEAGRAGGEPVAADAAANASVTIGEGPPDDRSPSPAPTDAVATALPEQVTSAEDKGRRPGNGGGR